MRKVIGIGETILDIIFRNEQPSACLLYTSYLAEQGAKIVILDRVEEAGRDLEAELNRKSEALFLVTDVLNKEEMCIRDREWTVSFGKEARIE